LFYGNLAKENKESEIYETYEEDGCKKDLFVKEKDNLEDTSTD
jgi:hypothetical protein